MECDLEIARVTVSSGVHCTVTSLIHPFPSKRCLRMLEPQDLGLRPQSLTQTLLDSCCSGIWYHPFPQIDVLGVCLLVEVW